MDHVERTRIFISYSHKDAAWQARLAVHLRPLERAGLIDPWDDTRIRSGDDWRAEITKALATARAAVLLLSADFLASDFIHGIELPALLDGAKARGLLVLPVLVGPCDLSLYPALAAIQMVNPIDRPLSAMSKADQEQCFVDLSKRLGEWIGPVRMQAVASVSTVKEPAMNEALAIGGAPVLPVAVEPPQRPGGRYSEAWYVHRERPERDALAFLGGVGRPAFILGPEGFGKTWFLDHLAATFLAREPEARVVRISLHALPHADRATQDGFFHFIAKSVVEQLEESEERLDVLWAQVHRGLNDRLRLLLRDILRARRAPLLIFIDHADAILDADYRNDFFGLLRAMAEDVTPAFGRLRQVLASSSDPVSETASAEFSSLYNLSVPIELDELDDPAVALLAARYGLAWRPADRDALHALVGGHPYLVSLAMYEARLHGTPLPTILDPRAEGSPFRRHLDDLRTKKLAPHPALHDALRRVIAGETTLPSATFNRLRRLALVKQAADGRVHLRCRLYEHLAR